MLGMQKNLADSVNRSLQLVKTTGRALCPRAHVAQDPKMLSPLDKQGQPPLFPNELKHVRLHVRFLTRTALQVRTQQLAEREPELYKRVGLSTIRNLEAGVSQPNVKTMITLAAALDWTPDGLFPLGPANPVRR